jgi:hypothetical protein
LNLRTGELLTVSTPDKKVAIKYNLDQLLGYYDHNKLKEGFRKNYEFTFKISDKTKADNGLKLSKATAENESGKITAWLAETEVPLEQLIPFLRLIGNWNEAQGAPLTIMEAEVNVKGKKETSVKVTVRKEAISAEAFGVPKNYLVKDFVQLMEEQKANKDLNTIIQTFAGF